MQLSATPKLGDYMPKAPILPVLALLMAGGEFMFHLNSCPAGLCLVGILILVGIAMLVFNVLFARGGSGCAPADDAPMTRS